MRNRDAYTIYLLNNGLAAFFFAIITTIDLIYQAEVAHLNPLQLVLVGTVLESTAFLCEIPTGVVADVYSRRLSIIIGTALYGAGFTLEGLVPRFGAILLAQVIWGAGATFLSGAEQAWIADELGDADITPVFLRGSQVAQAATLAGIPVSVALASLRLNLPVVVGGLCYFALAAFLAVAMPERGFRPAPRGERGSWRAMADTARAGGRAVRHSPLLVTILALAAFYGMSSEGFDRLWRDHFLDDFVFPSLGALQPVVWFGIISAIGTVLGIGAVEGARRWVRTDSHQGMARTLFVLNVLRIAGMLVFALAGNFALALAAYLVAAALRQANVPLYYAWLNRAIDSKVRATVLSLSGQVDALGQIGGGPVIGALGTAVSLRAAIAAAGAVLSPALLLYARAIRQDRAAQPAVEEASAVPEP
ncbi:MAG TPA: MFS transporter [Thermomicrobiales bacterium]|nr:MFS transporter [Thermomicrobiales bacterium]